MTDTTPGEALTVTRDLPTERVGVLEEKITSLNRRAARFGFPPMTLTRGPEVFRKRVIDGDDVYVGETPVTITGQPLRVAGFGLACVIDHENHLVLGAPGKACPARYWKAGIPDWGPCDRCHASRPRKRTYVLTNAQGESVQLGRECVKDYLGHPGAEELIGHAAAVAELLRLAEDDVLDAGAGAPRVRYDAERVLAMTFDYLAHHPYEKSDSDAGGTVAKMRAILRDKGTRKAPTAEGVEKAKQAITWLGKQPADTTYVFNLKRIAEQGSLDIVGGGLGIWVSLPIAYQRAAQRLNLGGHVGVVNERRVFGLTVERVMPFVGDYGTTYTYVFRDADGNVLTWRASSVLQKDGRDAQPGDAFDLLCTVTDHVTSKHGKETRLSRCAIAAPGDAERAKKRKVKADPLAKQVARILKRTKQVYRHDVLPEADGEDAVWGREVSRDLRRQPLFANEDEIAQAARQRAAEIEALLVREGLPATVTVEHVDAPKTSPDGIWQVAKVTLRIAPAKEGRQGNPAKTLRHLRPSATIRLAYEAEERDPNVGGAASETVSVTILGAPGEGFAGSGKLAYVRAIRRTGSPVFRMRAAGAAHGWGPLAYDLLMERVTELGASLAPDPDAVSDAAQAVWRKYATRSDVQRIAVGERFAGDGVYQKGLALLPVARKKAGYAEEGFPRANNPVEVGTAMAYGYLPSGFRTHREGVAEIVSRTFALAEGALGVRTKDEVLGCGSFGCVAPTEDGEVLKITTDWHEVLLFLLVWRYDVPGFARLSRGPVLLPIRDIAGRAAYAYTREDLPAPPGGVDVGQAITDILADFAYAAHPPIRVDENIARIAAIPSMRAIADGIAKLRDQHYDVQDIRPQNLAWQGDHLIVRDAMARARILLPKAYREGREMSALTDLMQQRERAARTAPARNPVTLSPTKADWPGASRGVALASLPQDELARGTAHEREHTPDRFLAQRIAADHLVEDPAYYTRLEAMERQENPTHQSVEAAMRPGHVYGLRVDSVRHRVGTVLGPSTNLETGDRLGGTSVIRVRKDLQDIRGALTLLSVYFGPWLTLVTIGDDQDLGPGTDPGERLFASPKVIATFQRETASRRKKR